MVFLEPFKKEALVNRTGASFFIMILESHKTSSSLIQNITEKTVYTIVSEVIEDIIVGDILIVDNKEYKITNKPKDVFLEHEQYSRKESIAEKI